MSGCTCDTPTGSESRLCPHCKGTRNIETETPRRKKGKGVAIIVTYSKFCKFMYKQTYQSEEYSVWKKNDRKYLKLFYEEFLKEMEG